MNIWLCAIAKFVGVVTVLGLVVWGTVVLLGGLSARGELILACLAFGFAAVAGCAILAVLFMACLESCRDNQ